MLAGTKCNKLLRLQLGANRGVAVTNIPLPPSREGRPQDAIDNCGIHAMSLNPSRTRLVTGGSNPCDCAVFDTPGLEANSVYAARTPPCCSLLLNMNTECCQQLSLALAPIQPRVAMLLLLFRQLRRAAGAPRLGVWHVVGHR